MTPRITSGERARRILSIVPWIAERDGPTIDEVCTRFGIARNDLLSDLETVFMVGVPPYTPDALIDVFTEDDRVWIALGDYFRRPLRLAPHEAVALLAAGLAVRDAHVAVDDDPLTRGLDKLAAAVGAGGDDPIVVHLGSAPGDVLDLVRRGRDEHRSVEIDYYTYGKDDRSTRVVDPYRVSARDGAWYLTGWCHTAGEERVFRIDRVGSARLLDDPFTPPPSGAPDGSGFVAGADDHRVTLSLPADAGWIAQHYPCEDVHVDGDRTVVTLAVGGPAFLTRLMLRFGPAARIEAVDGSGDDAAIAPWRQAVADTARRIADRYR